MLLLLLLLFCSTVYALLSLPLLVPPVAMRREGLASRCRMGVALGRGAMRDARLSRSGERMLAMGGGADRPANRHQIPVGVHAED